MTSQQYADMNTNFNASITTPASDGSHVIEIFASFLAAAGQTIVTLVSTPNPLNPIVIFVNRSQLPLSGYSTSSNTLTLTNALSLNDKVAIIYYA